jgi:hypothetical protein
LREPPDHHDAELLLRLYELRREEKLRQAREWFMREFYVQSLEESRQRFPSGSQENTYYRMVTSYWEMVASIVNHGLIKEDFFFENTGEIWIVWQRIKPLAPALRETSKNPLYWKNLESLCEKFEKWMAQRAPEALATLRKLIVDPPAKK